MAQRLIEDWQLAVLKVRLDLSERTPAVAAELVGYPGGIAQTMWSLRHPLIAYGLDSANLAELRVPSDLQAAVAKTLLTDLRGEAALWLRLVPPYGYLGAVPWEAALIERTNLPVLRVPDRMPGARDLGRKWRAAIAISAPPTGSWAPAYLRSLVHEWVRAVPAKVEVDVFADAWTTDSLNGVDWDALVRVHNPRKAAEASASPSPVSSISDGGTVSSAIRTSSGRIWADWIAAGLAGQAVRALHIVVDGAFDGDRPMLAVASDPSYPTTTDRSAFVSADTVLAFADGIGSAALSFSSFPNDPSGVAIRMIADEVGQQRSGATIYSSMAADPTGRALAAAHAYAADRSGEVEIPRDPSLFAYLQPEQVQDSVAHNWLTVLDQVTDDEGSWSTPPVSNARSTALETYYVDADSVPSWVASWDRYLGRETVELAQQENSLEPTAPFKKAYNVGASVALEQLRDILDRHTRLS
ncbi:MAG TPA: hypothetical protein VJ851_12860 [Jatrophihabitans sp.]|nr:hypothetical protein [Jatrophihabitans sp.]